MSLDRLVWLGIKLAAVLTTIALMLLFWGVIPTVCIVGCAGFIWYAHLQTR